MSLPESAQTRLTQQKVFNERRIAIFFIMGKRKNNQEKGKKLFHVVVALLVSQYLVAGKGIHLHCTA